MYLYFPRHRVDQRGHCRLVGKNGWWRRSQRTHAKRGSMAACLGKILSCLSQIQKRWRPIKNVQEHGNCGIFLAVGSSAFLNLHTSETCSSLCSGSGLHPRSFGWKQSVCLCRRRVWQGRRRKGWCDSSVPLEAKWLIHHVIAKVEGRLKYWCARIGEADGLIRKQRHHGMHSRDLFESQRLIVIALTGVTNNLACFQGRHCRGCD